MTSIISKLDGLKDQPQTLDPSRTIQVIGCGLGRTGTNSFSAALERLLHGPIYHTGTATLSGPEDTILTWTAITSPAADLSPEFVRASLKRLLIGHVGITDTHAALFTPELCALYPDAKVTCTTREEESWWRSWRTIQTGVPAVVIDAIFWPVPTFRYLTGFLNAMEGKFVRLYGLESDKRPGKELCGRHLEFVRRVVPPERLHFFDVKEGWAPLCEILGVNVPDEPFPRGNDARAMEELSRKVLGDAIIRWAQVLGAGVVVIGVVWWYLSRAPLFPAWLSRSSHP